MTGDDTIMRLQGLRLQTVREAAGFDSARSAALAAGWPESTYRAHEGGTRRISPRAAQRYVTWFKYAGAKDPKFNGRWVIYGDEDELKATDLHAILKDRDPAFLRRALQAILDLDKSK